MYALKALIMWRSGVAEVDADKAAHAHAWLATWIGRGQAEPPWQAGERAEFLAWERGDPRDKSLDMVLVDPDARQAA